MAIYTMEEMAEIMKEIPPSDPEMEEAIYFDVINRGFLLYDHKRGKAACTRCGHVWDIAKGEYAGMSHEKDICPMCESELTCLSAGRGRTIFTEYHRVMSFAEKDGTLWAILNEVIPVFEGFGRPNLMSRMSAVYKLNAKEQRYWHLTEPWGCKPYYSEPKIMKIPSAPGMVYGWSKYEDHVYTSGLKEMILRSDMKFLYEDWMPIEPKMSMIPRMAVQIKWPSVELLRKAGFEAIANVKLEGQGGARCVNWRGKNLEKILKLPKRWVKWLRPCNPSIKMLETFQRMTEDERKVCSRKALEEITYTYKNEKEYRQTVEQYMPFIKWIRLLDGWEVPGYGCVLRDYEDYISTAMKLGMDITKNSIKYPKDLKTAHDDVVARWKADKDKNLSKAIAARARIVRDYQIGNLTIVPALSQEDLNKESAGLCHCVKTYGDRIASGKCWIFFIRNIEEPDKPFYTMETTTTGELVQCRGLHNCSMTDEVKAFTEAFVGDLQKQVTKERKTRCKTA